MTDDDPDTHEPDADNDGRCSYCDGHHHFTACHAYTEDQQ